MGQGQRSIHRVRRRRGDSLLYRDARLSCGHASRTGLRQALQGDLHLLLKPARRGRRGTVRCPTAKRPLPADGNRIQIEVDDLATTVEKSRPRDAAFAMRS